jgi:hypothetical protein
MKKGIREMTGLLSFGFFGLREKDSIYREKVRT